MSKTKESVQYVQAPNFIAAWDVPNDRPLFNPGRSDSESWGVPERAIPPEMLGGYDVSKGAMVALEPEEFCRLFGISDFDKWVDEQHAARIAKFRAMADEEVIFSVPNPDIDIKKPMSATEETPLSSTVPVTITYGEVADYLESTAKRKVAYVVVAGQRRSYAAPFISLLHERANATKDEEGNTVAPDPFLFGLVVRQAETKADLHRMLLRENEQNSKQVYSEVGKAVNAIQFVAEYPRIGEDELGGLLSLNDIRDKHGKPVPGGNRRQHRQRFARIAALANHHRFVKCRILERIQLEPSVEDGSLVEYREGDKTKTKLAYVPGGYIPVSKLAKEELANLLGLTKETTQLQPIVKKVYSESWMVANPESREPNPTLHHAATVDEFERYVELLLADSPKPKGAIAKDGLQKLQGSTNVYCAWDQVGNVLDAILKGDEAYFDNLRAVETDEQLSDLVDRITSMDVFKLKEVKA